MSGMAILLLLATQVDNSGWRSTHSQTQSQPPYQSAPPRSTVLPAATADPWGKVDEIVERAERAIQDGVSSARDYVRQQADPAAAGGGRTALGGLGSNWPEVEQALGQPVSSQDRTAADDTLRNRIRGTDNVVTPVPRPPSGGPTSSRYSNLPPATGAPFDGASPRASIGPQRGSLRDWLEEDSNGTVTAGQRPPSQYSNPEYAAEPSLPVRSDAGVTATPTAGFPTSTDSWGSARDNSVRVGQAFPRSPSTEFGGADTQRREVVFEGQPGTDTLGRQRYITPPERVGSDELLRDVDSRTQPDAPVVPQEEPRLASGQPDSPLTLPTPPGADAPDAQTSSPSPATITLASSRPWGPLLMTVLGLFASLGFNFYLGWIAWDLYSRYQDAVDDVQELEAKLEAKQQELSTHPAVRTSSARRSTTVSL
jgi:hypothetical protein